MKQSKGIKLNHRWIVSNEKISKKASDYINARDFYIR
jgi:hypothetical protein